MAKSPVSSTLSITALEVLSDCVLARFMCGLLIEGSADHLGEGCPARGLAESAPGRDAEALHPGDKGRPRQSQPGGRPVPAAEHPVRCLQGCHDVVPLDLRERS